MAFHGSNTSFNPAEFKSSCQGTFGSGMYFGDHACALEYANLNEELVVCVQIDTSNLLYVKADYEAAIKHDLDTPALPLLQNLFNLSEHDACALFKKLAEGSEKLMLGKAIEQTAIKKGYKGLYLDYGDGAFEVALYDKSLITWLPSKKPSKATEKPSPTLNEPYAPAFLHRQ